MAVSAIWEWFVGQNWSLEHILRTNEICLVFIIPRQIVVAALEAGVVPVLVQDIS